MKDETTCLSMCEVRVLEMVGLRIIASFVSSMLADSGEVKDRFWDAGFCTDIVAYRLRCTNHANLIHQVQA